MTKRTLAYLNVAASAVLIVGSYFLFDRWETYVAILLLLCGNNLGEQARTYFKEARENRATRDLFGIFANAIKECNCPSCKKDRAESATKNGQST